MTSQVTSFRSNPIDALPVVISKLELHSHLITGVATLCGCDGQLVIVEASAPVLNGCVQRGYRLLGGMCQEPWQPTAHQESAVQSYTGSHALIQRTDFLFCFCVCKITITFYCFTQDNELKTVHFYINLIATMFGFSLGGGLAVGWPDPASEQRVTGSLSPTRSEASDSQAAGPLSLFPPCQPATQGRLP